MGVSLRAGAALALALASCSAPETRSDTTDPQDAFWDTLSSHCGNAYAGEIVSEDERDADWQGRDMLAHWAQCDERVIAIAFHMEYPERENGWDRSRTWVVTRTDAGLRLKHDHRHDDGEPDAVTMYGGDTADDGSATAQDFPVDQESIALFTREGLDASLTNVWRLEVTPVDSEDPHFVYQLTRRNDSTRRFRVLFDASKKVEPPPPAWGRK
ncbi:hypothetical protein JN10_0550 [Altererythrobacter ishigakiensis]|jgi:hypothetical protein|uniref:Lipoprotein n=1 Tax=Altererythrobacter ishigakiensis TaxID=476157 RepID=A0A562UTI2_9SPHN|nr:hypothetical protein JN10_0550 [Altererythrobacter ishigakiensis]